MHMVEHVLYKATQVYDYFYRQDWASIVNKSPLLEKFPDGKL